jgi:hypothetical protein
MTASSDLLIDAFDRIAQTVRRTTEGLEAAELSGRVDPDANTIAWLIWHLTRVQDDHVAEVAGRRQVWLDNGWAQRFGLTLDAYDTGYGHSTQDVGRLDGASAEDLIGYHDDVHARTVDYLRTIGDDDLASIVDDNWDPPVTLAVRLVSVISDDLQHVGQAAFVRGVLQRR